MKISNRQLRQLYACVANEYTLHVVQRLKINKHSYQESRFSKAFTTSVRCIFINAFMNVLTVMSGLS